VRKALTTRKGAIAARETEGEKSEEMTTHLIRLVHAKHEKPWRRGTADLADLPAGFCTDLDRCKVNGQRTKRDRGSARRGRDTRGGTNLRKAVPMI